ncbi:PAS domain-containing protein [Benzoatithermus flavus]|uniref:histidine kinase n=1 Tax=Benzoatithermus flavus TaxID=3108223 RepID=A0ABU8XU38_9PROT
MPTALPPAPWARFARLARRLLRARAVAVCRPNGSRVAIAAADDMPAADPALVDRLVKRALLERGPVALATLPEAPAAQAVDGSGGCACLAVPLPVDAGDMPLVLCAFDDGAAGWSEEDLAAVADLAEAAAAETALHHERTARRQAETMLAHEQERASLALAAGNMAVWETEIGTDRLIRPEAFTELLRLPPGRFEGSIHELIAFVLEEDRPALIEQREAMLAGEIPGIEAEFRVRCADGAIRWFRVKARVRRDGAGAPSSTLGVAMDVTALKEAESALRASEERHRLALAAMHGIVYEHDLASGRLSLSGEIATLLGLPEDLHEVDARWWMERVHPDDRAHLSCTLEEMSASCGSTSFSLEYRMRHQSGRWLHVRDRAFVMRDDAGRSVRLAGIVSDITESVLALEALRQNEQRLRLALASAPVALFEQDRDLRYRWTHNPNLPMHPAEMLGRTDAELFGPEVAAPLEAFKRRVLAGSTETAEVTLALPEGTRILELHAEPRHDTAGRVIGLTGAAIDITERKLAEEQREILLRELNHRVKNLLAVVQAIAHQTAARSETVPTFLQAFNGRLGALAAAQGKLTAHGWRGVDLRELVHQTLEPLDLADGRRVRTQVESLPVAARAAQSLALALYELATNASKYGALSVPEGGVELTASVTATPGQPALEIRWREWGGPPVGPPTRQGFGTRLLTRMIARQHHGQVHLDWDPAGLVCRLVLPLDRVLDRRQPFHPAVR